MSLIQKCQRGDATVCGEFALADVNATVFSSSGCLYTKHYCSLDCLAADVDMPSEDREWLRAQAAKRTAEIPNGELS